MNSIIQFSTAPSAEIDPLVFESEQEGFRFLKRLRDDWISGSNRFSGQGEALFGVYDGNRLLAIGGLNRESEYCGRLRRFYVKKDARRKGIGRLLINHILTHASQTFNQVVLRTDTETAAQFYVSVGFTPVSNSEGHSHTINLRPKQ